MWSNSSWQQWPQQSMYQNIPHEQVDWAALAKQWIQMREQSTGPSAAAIPSSGQSQNGPSAVTPIINPPVPSTDNAAAAAAAAPSGTFWNESSWGASTAAPSPAQLGPALEPASTVATTWTASPSVPVTAAAGGAPAPKETFDYGHMRNAEPLTAQSFDYNHGSEFNHAAAAPPPPDFVPPPVVTDYGHVSSSTDYGHGSTLTVEQFNYNEIYPPEPSYCQYWPQVEPNSSVVAPPPPPPPPFTKKERPNRSEQHSPQNEEECTQIDASKRKQLPAWIREGLEKMERERQKKMEKELLEKGLSQNPKSMDAKPALGDAEEASETGSSPKATPKSRFDTESDEDDEPVVSSVAKQTVPSRNASPQRSPSPAVTYVMTEEERMADMMLKVRRLLTEILLEVTNEEIAALCKEVYQRALAKAPARQLATSSALASITGGLGGLAGYGSDSDKDTDEEKEDEEDDSSSDEELQRRIQEKQRAFALREKEILAALDEEEAREQDETQKEAPRTAKKFSENPQSSRPPFLPPTRDPDDSYESSKIQVIPGLDIGSDVRTQDKEIDAIASSYKEDSGSSSVSNNIQQSIGAKLPGNSDELMLQGKTSNNENAKFDERSSRNRNKRLSQSSSSRDRSSSSSSDSSSSSGREKRSRTKDRYDKEHKNKRKHRSKDRKKHRSRSRSPSQGRSRHRSRSRSHDRYRSSKYHRASKYRSPSRSPSYSRSSKKKKKEDKYSRHGRRSRSYSYSPKRSRSRSTESDRLVSWAEYYYTISRLHHIISERVHL